jgi:cytosol alanyl aminopeptidase
VGWLNGRLLPGCDIRHVRIAAGLLVSVALLAAPAFRLPDTVRPRLYTLDLTLDPAKPLLPGHVEIDAVLSEAVRTIHMNAKDLTVRRAWIEAAGKRSDAHARLREGEFLDLDLDRAISPGPIRIVVDFTAKLDDRLAVGAYRRTDGANWYAFTTFTAIEARRAFPCFDQPEFKTPWRITLTVPAQMIAVSNAPVASIVAAGDRQKRVVFEETQPLPTEVVAFAAGPFDVIEDGVAGVNGVPVRILTPHGRASEAIGVRSATRAVLARLEDYTHIPYPWKKMDHLAVLDLPFGAVENPGLITYNQRVLLAIPERDTAEHRHGGRATMTHELAHQWFGNLVTQRWWDDVWLSEGFATWLASKTGDLDLPEYQRGIAAVESRGRIMSSDNRAVRLGMNSRAEMQNVYSAVVYQKGAAVLRMVEHWLGAEPFRRGLGRYLNDHAFAAATTADLALALRTESGIDVSAVLGSYLDQPGFPIVRATVDCPNKRIEIEQQSKLSWTTPVCVRQTCEAVSGALGAIPLKECPAYIWPNAGGAGYYRSLTESLPDLLNKGLGELTIPERLSIAQDIPAMPAAQQMAALRVLLRDADSSVAGAAAKAALQLATMPNANIEELRRLLRQSVH